MITWGVNFYRNNIWLQSSAHPFYTWLYDFVILASYNLNCSQEDIHMTWTNNKNKRILTTKVNHAINNYFFLLHTFLCKSSRWLGYLKLQYGSWVVELPPRESWVRILTESNTKLKTLRYRFLAWYSVKRVSIGLLCVSILWLGNGMLVCGVMSFYFVPWTHPPPGVRASVRQTMILGE